MRNQIRLVLAVLIGIALTSLGVGAFALTSSYRGNYWSAVYSKSYGSGDWIYLTDSWQTLLQITLPSLPAGLYYHVVCDGYAEGDRWGIAIGVDSLNEDWSTSRYYITGSYLQTGVHTERVYQLGAGSHTFYFRGGLIGVLDTAMINRHTITVTVYTDGSVTG